MKEAKFIGYMWEGENGEKFWGHKPKEDDEILMLLEKMIKFEIEMSRTMKNMEASINKMIVIIQTPPTPSDNPATKIIFDCQIVQPGV